MTASEVDMGGYSDYCAHPVEGEAPVAGICHARGQNADMHAMWLVYIAVRDLEASIECCLAKGGKLRCPIRDMGSQGRFCVIEDPAGAVAGLYQSLLRAA